MFEQMRKEQHKTFQGKQNKMCDEYKENLDPEVAETLDAPGNFKSPVTKHNEPDDFAASLSPANDPAGIDFNAQTSAEILLPLVNKTLNFGSNSVMDSSISEVIDYYPVWKSEAHSCKSYNLLLTNFKFLYNVEFPKQSYKYMFDVLFLLPHQPGDVRRDHMEGYTFHSSDFAHQFLEGILVPCI